MYEKRTLPNGVRILFEEIPYVRSAAAGIWTGTGSRHEGPEESGISHFIEHMVFKGTASRSAAQLAELTDAIGGQVNAYTTKEYTCFYAHALDDHLPLALDLLCDMFFCSRFEDSDVNTERGVILEEIGMYEDTPEDLCTERLFSAIFRGSSLSRPILGRPAALRRITGRRLRAWRRDRYLPQHTVVALSGRFSPADIDYLCDRFSQMSGNPRPEVPPASYTPAITVRKKEIEQNHLCIAFPGTSATSPDRYTMQLLSVILGGGVSSRLFQLLREQLGLCYNIYTFGAGHADIGVLCIYVALNRAMEPRAFEAICKTVREFRENGVTEAELARAREQVKAYVLMGMESTTSRMNPLARSELFYGRIPSYEEITAAYDAVTRAAISALARNTLDFDRVSLSAVGNVRTSRQYAALLQG
jgi:predicted Zn-dependent peptidase